MSAFRVCFIFFSVFTLFFISDALGQEKRVSEDSLFIKGKSIIFRGGEIEYIPNDTVIFSPKSEKLKVEKDPYHQSKKFYDSLEQKMGRSWFTKEIYNLMFKPESKNNMADTVENYRAERFFTQYEGYKIRNIYLKKVDVLEGSVDDTLLIATTDFGKLINDIHVNTRDWVIKKFLLFDQNDRVHPYELADNERIIRNLSFIEDARIKLNQVSEREVDVHVITQDIFSIGVDGGIETDDVSARLFDKNFMGTGGEISVGTVYQRDSPQDRWGFNFGLDYINFWGSFVDGEFQYINTNDFDLVRFDLKKDFLTPEIKYAGELDIGWKADVRYDKEMDTTYEKPFQLRYGDVWLGRSFILDGGLERTNLILALRTGQQNYLNRPVVSEDSNVYFHDRKFVLSSISVKKINYLKSSKILGFGQVEDIPYGYIVKLLAGYSSDEFYRRPYLGAQFTAGKYFDKIGYFGVTNKLGTFWRARELNELLLTVNLIYYTPLVNLGRYQSRNIITSTNNFGINRTDQRGVNFSDNIRAFQNGGLSGLGSFIFSYENILYTPWYFYGFKFAPFLFADVGVLSDKGFELAKPEVYSSLGLGLRVRNESLTISTIELRFAYLPKLANGGSHFNMNFSIRNPTLFTNIFDDKPTFNTFNVN